MNSIKEERLRLLKEQFTRLNDENSLLMNKMMEIGKEITELMQEQDKEQQ